MKLAWIAILALVAGCASVPVDEEEVGVRTHRDCRSRSGATVIGTTGGVSTGGVTVGGSTGSGCR